ncbi:MAG: response regulator [Myxococcales bacterium]|nr:response regulator [Myxococcales bacterium]
MHVLIVTTDDELAARVEAELRGADHSASRWQPGKPHSLMGRVAVVDGGPDVVAAVNEAEPGLPVIALCEPRDVGSLACRGVASFALKPLAPGEIVARCQVVTTRMTVDSTREKLLVKAVEAANDIIEITNQKAVLQFVNNAYERTLGFTAEEAVGKTPAQLVRSDMHDREFFQAIDLALSRPGGVWRGVIISRARDGRLVHLESTVSAVANDDGVVTHHVGVKRDITKRLEERAQLRRANKALAQARDAALAASRAKSEFLANMSHELRTPLNAILGYSEMLLEDAEDRADEASANDLLRIKNAGEHLLSLINDVLDISKIEAGHMDLCIERFDLSQFIDGVLATVQPLVAERGNALSVERPRIEGEGRALIVSADEMKLKQALLNLLSNANKFTEKGDITLELRLDEREGRQWLHASVKDTGIGISSDQVARLFQPFVQADASTTRRFGGTGLGLAISKRFCEMMGGTITVESEVGAGSTFTLTVPRHVATEADSTIEVSTRRATQAPRAVTVADATHTILLIDDDQNVQDLLLRSLSASGYRVECVSSGPEGIERARELRPDAVILDVLMPGMDGWTVLGTLKADDLTADIPVIMLTMIEQRSQGIALGASDYLVKPVDRSRLLGVLGRLLPREAARVLIVEDDEDTRTLMRRTVEGIGHEVIEAENGQVALDKLDALGGRPDIVLLDLMMPVMDGFTFLGRLREQPRYDDMPVVVVTAREFAAAEREELSRLAYRIIEKGAKSREQLVDTVQHWVRSRLGADVE